MVQKLYRNGPPSCTEVVQADSACSSCTEIGLYRSRPPPCPEVVMYQTGPNPTLYLYDVPVVVLCLGSGVYNNVDVQDA